MEVNPTDKIKTLIPHYFFLGLSGEEIAALSARSPSGRAAARCHSSLPSFSLTDDLVLRSKSSPGSTTGPPTRSRNSRTTPTSTSTSSRSTGRGSLPLEATACRRRRHAHLSLLPETASYRSIFQLGCSSSLSGSHLVLTHIPSLPPSCSTLGSMEGNRAKWNALLENGLVDTLLEYNTPRYRSDNGWRPEGWTKILETMNKKFPQARFVMQQVKEHESEMKKSYKVVKKLKETSGMGWQSQWCMLHTKEEVWKPLIKTNPKVKKWKSKPFPHYEACEKLYAGCIAEGHNNRTTIRNPNDDMASKKSRAHVEPPSPPVGEASNYQVEDDDNESLGPFSDGINIEAESLSKSKS